VIFMSDGTVLLTSSVRFSNSLSTFIFKSSFEKLSFERFKGKRVEKKWFVNN